MTTISFITQEYFDELCIENFELFEMNDTTEAVQETLVQIHRLSASSGRSDTGSTKHLTLTYPDELGRDVRTRIREFEQALRTLSECHEAFNVPPLLLLEAVYERIHSTGTDDVTPNDDRELFTHLFLIHDGFSIYFAVLNQLINASGGACAWTESAGRILQTMNELISRSAADTLTPFQVSVNVGIVSLTKLFEQELDSSEFMKNSRIAIILSTIHSSIVHFEPNKKLWIACQIETSSFPKILIKTLQRSATTSGAEILSDTRDTAKVPALICTIIATLCTFDDFKGNHYDDGANVAPIVQSGHTAVQALYQAGAIPIIHELVVNTRREDHGDPTIIAACSAMRALAIQDDVVQCMEKIGVIDNAVQVLQNAMETGASSSDRKKEACQLIIAIIGLCRNVAANDDIKTALCIGRNKDVVQHTIQAMEMYQDIALLQEHGCGLFAAMALRKPKNAVALVGFGVHKSIVNVAMQQHPTSVTVQRQGALAIRNIASRSPELRPMILNDCDTEATLRTIAGQHLRCQDEVYAALRDLGLEARSVHVHQAEDGTVTVQEGRSVFGVRNPNFRPDFTTSDTTMSEKYQTLDEEKEAN